ncbi:MAG: putative peptidoglycan lipid II flippase [Ulvibacter sp.]|jgi:putative peptidoglycan lipid II flippase
MSQRIIKNSIFVLLLIAGGKVLSFLRDVIISSQFGSTYQTDAYFAANNIPSIIFTAILSSYIVLLIPNYKKIQVKDGVEEANIFVSKVINLFFIVSLLLSFLGFYFIEELLYLVAPGFNDETRELGVVIGKILILSFPFSSATLILSTISNANNKYYAPHIIPAFSAFFIIVCILLFSDEYGIITLAVAGVAAFFFQLLIQIFISKNHFKYTIKVNFFDKNIKKMSWLVLPIFLGFSIDQINLLVNSIISSNLAEGSLSSLNYAQRLQATINGTFSTALITVIYPLISGLLAENNIERLTSIMTKSLRGVFLVLFPIIVFLSLNSEAFVAIVYYRGEFDSTALEQTSSIFFFYSFNVLFISLREVILRLYYIKENTKMPFITSGISLVINIVLSLILVKYLDVSGLALANLVATAISTLLLFTLISSNLKININLAQILKFGKTVAMPMLIFISLQILLNRYFDIAHNIIFFLVAFCFSVIVYALLLLIFKQKDVLQLIKMIMRS